MTAKYSTGSADHSSTRWGSDTRHVLATWTTNPFVGVSHRHETVEHRLVVQYEPDVGADLLHECRSEDTEKFAADWRWVQRVEIREYGARYDRRPEARWAV